MVGKGEVHKRLVELTKTSAKPRCNHKFYYSAQEAKRIMKLKNLDNKFNHLERPLTGWYFCNYCGGWHLTSMSKERARNTTHWRDKI